MIRPFLLSLFFMGCSTEIKPVVNLPPAPQGCKTIKLDPIPDKVYLNVQGSKVFADDGGEQILRGYAACRGMYK